MLVPYRFEQVALATFDVPEPFKLAFRRVKPRARSLTSTGDHTIGVSRSEQRLRAVACSDIEPDRTRRRGVRPTQMREVGRTEPHSRSRSSRPLEKVSLAINGSPRNRSCTRRTSLPRSAGQWPGERRRRVRRSRERRRVSRPAAPGRALRSFASELGRSRRVRTATSSTSAPSASSSSALRRPRCTPTGAGPCRGEPPPPPTRPSDAMSRPLGGDRTPSCRPSPRSAL